MTYKWQKRLLLVGAVLASGCAEKSDSDLEPPGDYDSVGTTDTGDAGDDGAGRSTIPDPGTDYAPLRWYDDGGYHGTPETAQVMGILLDVPDYIQGGIDPDTCNHYFVFRTYEDQTEFSVNLFDKTSEIEHVRIHDGTGLVFGDEVPATSVTSAVQAEWELEGDTVYVLAVHSPIGGFF